MRISLQFQKSFKEEAARTTCDEFETGTGRDGCWVLDTDEVVVVGAIPFPLRG